jgi:transcriptional regulator with XRE-family HTH domain
MSTTLSEAIAAEFRRVLLEKGLSVTAAARELRVTRQAFHAYLNTKSVPRTKTLARAMILWDLKITVGDIVFDKSSLPTKKGAIDGSPSQMTFLDAWDSLKPQDLKITASRDGSSIRLQVNINIPA